MKNINFNGVDETVFYDKTLYNMPVYIWENKNLNGFYISLCVKYGSLHTDFKYKNKIYSVPLGIAHYMEHIKFNEKKGSTAHDYYNKLGSDINAFTTFEYTNYEVSGNENYKENLSHLIKYVLTPYFTKEIINKERGIISEEIKMDKDNPYSKLFYKSLENTFSKSHYRNLVSGNIEDIKNITIDDINLIFEAFYHPENMFLVVSGNVNRFETIKIVNDTLSKLDIGKYSKAEIIVPKEPLKIFQKEDIYKDLVVISKTKISLKIPLNKFKGIDKDKIIIYIGVLLNVNFGNISDFKQYLLDNEMINYFNTSKGIYDDYVIITFTYESDVYEAVKDLILDKLKKLDINSSDLKRRTKCSVASTILAFESKEMISSFIQEDIINYNKIQNNIIDIYNNIKLSEIKKIAKIINTNNISITTVIPK